MSADAPRLLVAAGGTGGHLFPAIAVAEEVRKRRPKAEFLFVGTKTKIEARVVPRQGYPFATIWISGFHRTFRLSNLLFPLKVVVAFVQSFLLIRRFRPDVALGTGGYVCGPVLSAAARLGIPVAVHESNSVPGVTTRMMSRRARIVFTAFEETQRSLPRTDNVVRVGTPVRASLGTRTREEGCRRFGLDPSRPVVLVFGGSLGARSMNAAVASALIPEAERRGVQLIWQTGPGAGRPAAAPGGSVWTGAFIDEMEDAYAAADLVVSRSGAATVAELTRLGCPAVLVPYPRAAADHQTANARTLVDAGAAEMIPDAEVGERLAPVVGALLASPERLAAMRAASAKLGRADAASEIAGRILALIR